MGADFEGNGIINRCGNFSIFFCFTKRANKTKRIILIKGPFCFIYNIDNLIEPKYAISLLNIKPIIKDNNNEIVMLQNELGDTLYEIQLDKSDDNKIESKTSHFIKVILEQSNTAQSDIIRENLGHGHLLKKHSSVRYAEEIALNKYTKNQPDEPIKAKEILESMNKTLDTSNAVM